MRIASPERRWRVATAVLAGGALGWYTASRSSSSTAIVVGSVIAAASLGTAVLIARSHLEVGEEGLTDRRTFRVVRLSWLDIAEFGVGRPGGPWGGFCVFAIRRDRSRVDLLSTRAYTRVPSVRHLDELHRISWTLAEAASSRRATP